MDKRRSSLTNFQRISGIFFKSSKIFFAFFPVLTYWNIPSIYVEILIDIHLLVSGSLTLSFAGNSIDIDDYFLVRLWFSPPMNE